MRYKNDTFGLNAICCNFCDRGIGSESDSTGKFEFILDKLLNGFHETGKIVLVKIFAAGEIHVHLIDGGTFNDGS